MIEGFAPSALIILNLVNPKEKYGGLKKFLERYPEEVVICADHPFNPHVFLRKPLNRGDLELIAKGIIPPHLRKVCRVLYRGLCEDSGVLSPCVSVSLCPYSYEIDINPSFSSSLSFSLFL